MTKNDTKMTPEMMEELWQKREAEYKRRYGINVTQREAKRILEYVSFDFLSLITFMIVYGKYPYNLAYMRIWDVITLLENINCKNKEKFFIDYLFDWVEFEDEAKGLIERYYSFIDSSDKYDKKTHMYPKRKNLYFKDAPKNIIIFRKLIEKHLFGNLDYGLFQTDFWHCACERLFLNKKLFWKEADWDFEKLAFTDNETTDV